MPEVSAEFIVGAWRAPRVAEGLVQAAAGKFGGTGTSHRQGVVRGHDPRLVRQGVERKPRRIHRRGSSLS